MPRRSALFLIFLSFHVFALAQQLPFKKYTSKDGLISDRITAITQDEKGFMWFGSYFGLCQYDGTRFKKIELPPSQKNKYVNCILAANGKVYAGFLFGGGLAEYENGKTRCYFVKGKDSLAGNEFVSMYDQGDGSILLLNTALQVFVFKNGVFTKIIQLPNLKGSLTRHILKDRYNSIWIGGEQGLYIIPIPYTRGRHHFPGQHIFSLVKDQKGEIWFCRNNGKGVITQRAKESNDGNIHGLTVVRESGQVREITFSGNTGNGFWELDYLQGMTQIRNHSVNHFQVPLDMNSDISIIYSDRENNLWIANEPGVIKVSSFNIQTYLFDELAAGGGDLQLASDSLVWVSNSKALYTISNNGIKKKSLKQNNPNYYGLLHIDDKKNLWVGYWNEGIFRTQASGSNMISIEDHSTFENKKIKVSAIVGDSRGNIWVGGPNGIFRIHDNRFIDTYHPVMPAGSPVFISCMTIDEENKTLWLGDNAMGVIEVKYAIQPGGEYRYTTGRIINEKNGLKDNYTRSLLFDRKRNLWIGTRNGGIYKVFTGKGELEVEDCNVASGITCTRVTDIEAENDHAVWFATCDGIYRYSYQNNHWDHFNTSDGLLNAEVFNISVDERNGLVWTLTSQGVTRIRMNAGMNTVAPLISITSVNVLGKPDTAAMMINEPVKYTYDQNSIGFVFAGASFIDEKSISYKYMLEGHNNVWSDPVTTNNVNYASLPPGKYTFKVMAANAKGEWSAEPARFSFEIVRPFYKSPWFILLTVTIVFIIIYFVRIQRLKQRYKIEKLRLNIARDLHDDVGSTLGSINILSKTASRKMVIDPTPETITPIFDKIGESAENTLEAMDDIVWSINPSKDKLNDLIVRMREFAIPLLEAANIHFIFDTGVEGHQSIPMDVRRNIFLVYKESIYNILKHSRAGKVKISIRTDKEFNMHIDDDGVGFTTYAPTRSNGLRNMQNRAEAVRGRLHVHSSTNGTSVHFSAPLR